MDLGEMKGLLGVCGGKRGILEADLGEIWSYRGGFRGNEGLKGVSGGKWDVLEMDLGEMRGDKVDLGIKGALQKWTWGNEGLLGVFGGKQSMLEVDLGEMRD